jgi:hypothetical protein
MDRPKAAVDHLPVAIVMEPPARNVSVGGISSPAI